MKRTQAYKCAHKCNKKIMKTYENWRKTYDKREKRTTREKNVHKRKTM